MPVRWTLLFLALLLSAAPSAAQDRRLVEVQFTPTERAQLALWIESADGERFETLRLTESLAYRGIGNRPGASTMNSGFRWPYGRREGALPVWAHRRLAAGQSPFPRVIFQDRRSEGLASRTSADHSRDEHFCLSFAASLSSREALDAVSCASVFNSDKGRYVTDADVASGYSEPLEDLSAGIARGRMEPLLRWSPYPPRRDVTRCVGGACFDHTDVGRFRADALAAMPELDAVTMATPAGGVPQNIVFEVPESWPDGDYTVSVEIAREGDYNATFDDSAYPTPTLPAGAWDTWAISYGYPFRGQPSVVFSIPFRIGGGGSYATRDPVGFGSVSGTGPDAGDIRPMSDAITDDPVGAPGSGADRLGLSEDGRRLRVVTVGGSPVDPPVECDPADPDPPAACCAMGHPNCDPTDPPDPPDPPCEGALICFCATDNLPPEPVEDLQFLEFSDESGAHHFAHLSFRVPHDDGDAISRYEVRVGTSPIVDEESFFRALPAKEAVLDSIELMVPTDGEAGELVELDVGGLSPQTQYYIGVRARDACDDASPLVVAEVTTTPIHFTTVSPCFVATAAWGSPMAREIRSLRRFRDRHLRTNLPGRAFVALYEQVGPHLADVIRVDAGRRRVAREILAPFVWLARAMDE